MVDSVTIIRVGEKMPVYGVVTAQVGHLLTIQPGSIFSLTDNQGNIIAGLNGVAVTGYTPNMVSQGLAWYDIDTAALAIVRGNYYGYFKIPTLGDENPPLPRNYEPTILIQVRYTYE